MLVGAVADDDSGMTDLLGMFAEHGVNTVMFFETQPHDVLERYSKGVEVVAIGTRGRSIEPKEAYRKTRESLEALKVFNPPMYYLKYCSTFDSTPRGNIGQMIDAGLDLFGGYTIALPALPINGRTTYMGNHFVNGVRLDRSPMKDHPLNPMTEADLRIWLGYQTKRRIGLVNYNVVKKGAEAVGRELKRLGETDVEIIIMDAIGQRDIRTIAKSVWDYELVTGGSALAMELPPIWRKKSLFSRERLDFSHIDLKRGVDATLIIAGSCSQATMGQNRYALERGFHDLKLDTTKIVEGEGSRGYHSEVRRVVKDATGKIKQGKNVLVYTCIRKEDVAKTKRLGRKLGLTDFQIGDSIADANAEIAKAVIDAVDLNKLIVAGGETSGIVCRKLKLIGLYVGKQIHPGVPTCFAISEDPQYSGMILSLKSGNFGEVNFYEEAPRQMDAYTHVENMGSEVS